MEEKNDFDQNLYSRQAAVYGESMGKLIKLRVFLYGLKGTGIEVAKNVALAGPAVLCLHDPSPASKEDMATNFYLAEQSNSTGSRTDMAVKDKIQELNQYVKVQVCQQPALIQDLSFYEQFDVVVFTDCYQVDAMTAINDHCRANNIGFIIGGCFGLYGYSFTDFGDNYKNFDKDGEQNRQCIVTSITQDKEGAVVTVHEDKKHLFQDGDSVIFREVEGMTEINGQTVSISIISPISFRLSMDSSSFTPYLREGVVEQVKVQTSIPFRSLRDSFVRPLGPELPPQERCLINPDCINFGRSENLHICLQALYQFNRTQGRSLKAHNMEDLDMLYKMAEEVNAFYQQEGQPEDANKVEEIDKDTLIQMNRFGNAQISPVASFFGAIVSQEIIKYTGKFMPIRQWLHIDFFKVVPDPAWPKDPLSVERTLHQDRYDHLITILGNKVQEKLSQQKMFMIGAGALGCEFIKMFSLMGMAQSTSKGSLVVTDDDIIEVSNLNRQFLFRKDNVGQSKSQCAVAAGVKMNPAFSPQGCKLRTCVETEEYFNDTFWEGLDFVVNAVDNVQARLYTDGRCVFYSKALFESGTLGTKCNSQVIIPKLTQSYGETPDQKEEEFAICTLKNFPYLIEHTIQWARDIFEGVFVDGPCQLRAYIASPTKFVDQLVSQNQNKFGVIRDKLETIQELMEILEHPEQKESKVLAFSRRLFEHSFHHIIAELQSNFPQDHKTEEGQLFWSGPKRYPQTQPYNPKDPLHALFMHACGNILLETLFGLKACVSQEQAVQLALDTDIPMYVPKKLKVTTNNNNQDIVNDEDEEIALQMIEMMKGKDCSSIKDTINLTEFEKDDDTNFHIDFLTAVANLRGRNYRIVEVDKLKVKLTAGKIIPAIATTTAMVCGAITMEMLKYVQNKPIDDYKNTFMNLAVNVYVFPDPLAPTKTEDKDYDPIMMGPVKAIPAGFTTWDKIRLSNCETLQNVIDQVKEQYGVILSIIGCGRATIYNIYSNKAEMNIRVGLGLRELYKRVAGVEFPAHKKFMEIEVSGDLEDGSDTLLPSVVINLE